MDYGLFTFQFKSTRDSYLVLIVSIPLRHFRLTVLLWSPAEPKNAEGKTAADLLIQKNEINSNKNEDQGIVGSKLYLTCVLSYRHWHH